MYSKIQPIPHSKHTESSLQKKSLLILCRKLISFVCGNLTNRTGVHSAELLTVRPCGVLSRG